MYTDDNSTTIILRIAKKLAPKYVFPGYDVDDICQEAVIIGLRSLEKYDKDKGSLSAYLYVHINNRLKTFKRDNYMRPIQLCENCENKKREGSYQFCTSCSSRVARNSLKHNILAPTDISEIDELDESSVDSLELEELQAEIQEHLPMEMRADYLKILDNVYVPKQRRLLIEKEIGNIYERYVNGK